jgi:hypothetical protein
MRPTGFTLRLGEGTQRVTIETLAKALETALELLRNVGQEFTPAGTVVRWEVVGGSQRSPLTMSFAPSTQGESKLSPDVGRRIASACVQGFRQLEKKPVLPAHFNEEALVAAEKLIQVAQGDRANVTVGVKGRRGVTPTTRAIRHIRELVTKASIHHDHGRLEGCLEELSIHGARHIVIWEEMTDERVECVITPDRLEEMRSLLGQRVAVSGRVRYRNDMPTSIVLESVRGLPDVRELP